MNTTSQPHWYSERSMTAWDRVKEALRRDWEQTKHHLGLPGGHELNQTAMDTLKQAANAESIPAADRPNPPRVIGSWEEVEYPIAYGYTARWRYGHEHPTWNEGIEQRLRSEWEARHNRPEQPWGTVVVLVRYGYEHSLHH